MGEYLIQDTTLTGIADKIRSLLGLTGKMSPAQMQTNLTTEQANITAALAALTEKGVTVPAGANSNALAALIAAIESGGGKIVAGLYTPASTQSSRVTITHGLGTDPTGVLFAKYHTDKNATDTVLFAWKTGGLGIRHMIYNNSYSAAQISVSGAESQVHAQNQANGDIVCGLTETTFQTPKNLYAGTYIWVVFGEVLS